MQNIISSKKYIKSPRDMESLKILMRMMAESIQSDGVRNRAYLKLIWDRDSNQLSIAKNQGYFQSTKSNNLDGGKQRQFSIMNNAVLDLDIMRNVFDINLERINNFNALRQYKKLVIGLHFIQYKVDHLGASYSSPDSLHVDDEPLVFVHLLNLTDNAWGGDNLIADLETKEIRSVIRLEQPFETLMLTQDYYHAVTPLGASKGQAYRDILLFTVEPDNTQVEFVA